MISNTFDKLYKRLNPEQKLAVDEIEGPVMVIAGPGTGKTQILTLRIANILIKTQVNPENILALTFTESAKSEMRQRLVEIIGTPAYRVQINTFHGFSNEVIKSNPENFPHLISSESITEVEQIESLEKIITNTDLQFLKPFGDPLYYLKPSLSEISNLKKEGIDSNLLEEAIKKWEDDFTKIDDLYHEKGKYAGEMKGKYQDELKSINKTKELLLIYKKYQEYLLKERKYDFNDMLLEVKKALENDKGLLLRLQEKYQYILIDEHQDTNAVQNKIAELLGSFFEDNPNLFVVGDEKQAIFRFQGASLENFLYFQKKYPKAKIIKLTENYRSHQKILDAVDSLISNNITANLLSPKKIILHAQSKKISEPIKLAVLNNYFTEYQFIVDDISKKIKQGIPLEEIAIIGRNNKDLKVVAESLERNGIPYSLHSDQNIFNDLYMQKLILILEAVGSVGKDFELLKVMHIDLFNIEPLDIYKIMGYARKNRSSVYEVLSTLNKSLAKELKLKSFDSLISFYQKLNNWQKTVHNESFEKLFIQVINESGFKEAILKSPKRLELLDKLITLFEEIKSLVEKNPKFGLKDFLDYLQMCQKHELPLKSHVISIDQKAVKLMTAHRSKGLEFDYVYIVNAYDGHWGNAKKRSAGLKIPWDILGITLNLDTENEDERRLFYVAMTRARQDIIITYSTRCLEGTEKIPSQFLSEINPKLVEKIDTEKFEKDFLQKKEVIFDVSTAVKIPVKNESSRGEASPRKDQQFFKELFLLRGLSATGLDNYLKCPWQYFYRNLLQFPESKENYLIFGTAIHFALDSFIYQRKIKKLTGNFLVEKFSESLDNEFLVEQDRKTLLEKGKKALLGYFENIIPTWGKETMSELKISGVKLTENVTITGRLDMIEIISGNSVAVHDFKTGKIKSRSQIDETNEKSDYHYLRQLTFYKILLDRSKNGLMKMTEGVIDFIEPNEKGIFKSEKFEVTEIMAKDLEKEIIKVSNEIINLEFWDKRCDDLKCEYCKLRDLTISE
ncbi:MAG: ATP-dependent DNA helicase [Candidatus Daviesbacteria bacterium]|nr:ATP-dependent DNA helicase [Candidatus Daviesbacteria bacterium]